MSGLETATRADGHDMVLRFRPKEGQEPDLAQAVSGIVRRQHLVDILGKEVDFRIRVLQPVVGSPSSDWELRITVPTLEELGKLLDWASGPKSWSGDDSRTVLSRLLDIDGVEVIGEGVPLYRAWQIT